MKQKILLIVSGICVPMMSSHAALVAHYKFDEAASATVAVNQVSGSTAGAVGAAVTTGVAGISGNAYSFGGATATQADIVDMGNASFFSAITTSNKYTLSAWIKTSDTTNNRNTVVYAGSSTVNNVYADLGVAAGQAGALGAASARNRPSGSVAPQDVGIYSTPTVAPVNNNAWHHLAMTVDISASKLSLYVDGVLANTQTMAIGSLPSFNNFEIGRLGRPAPVDPYQGLVDDVQVYDQDLTLSEVQYLFANPGLAVPEPGAFALAGVGLLSLAGRKRL